MFELPKANLSQFSRTQEKLKQFEERLVEERKKRLEERKKQRKEDRRKAFYNQKEEEAQRIHEEQLKKGLYSEFSFSFNKLVTGFGVNFNDLQFMIPLFPKCFISKTLPS